MKRMIALLRGLAYGAALMYFLDPQLGRERQKRMRDRLMGYRDEAEDIFQNGTRDLKTKARGLLAEAKARVQQVPLDDDTLAERARARLAMLGGRTGGVNVRSQDGGLVLEGDILREDLDRVMMGLENMRGISRVDNHLQVHSDPGEISALNGVSDQPGQMRWSPGTRLLAGLGSLYLLMRGRGGGILSPLFTLGGLAIGTQVMTNKSLRSMAGFKPGPQGAIHVVKTITVHAPVEEVYRMWQNFPNFSRFMSHIRSITDLGEGKSHWVVEGPAGVPVEFDTVITLDAPNEMIAWATLPGSLVDHSGRVRFRSVPGGTQVNVRMAYTPPAGALGHAVASFFGSDPKSAMDQDLQRFKTLMETGETQAEGEQVRQEDVMER